MEKKMKSVNKLNQLFRGLVICLCAVAVMPFCAHDEGSQNSQDKPSLSEAAGLSAAALAAFGYGSHEDINHDAAMTMIDLRTQDYRRHEEIVSHWERISRRSVRKHTEIETPGAPEPGNFPNKASQGKSEAASARLESEKREAIRSKRYARASRGVGLAALGLGILKTIESTGAEREVERSTNPSEAIEPTSAQ
jgi:hypothetical protein